eukprot:jgi/Picsp_1/4943/NSC_02307-R1_ankyrin
MHSSNLSEGIQTQRKFDLGFSWSSGLNDNSATTCGRANSDMPVMIAMRGHVQRIYEDTFNNVSPMEKLSVAISQGDISTVRHILNQTGPEIQLNVALDHERGHAPLTLAAKHGHGDIVTFLIESGADVEQRNACSDMTAVMYAMIERHGHVVEALIRIGARVQDRNRYGWTAVMMAVMYGTADTLGCVLGTPHGVDLSSDDCGKALLIAVAQGKAGHVAKLLDAGANVNYRNGNNEDAFELALKHGHEDIALMIAQKKKTSG